MDLVTPDFDRVAGIYRALEYGAFGGTLQRARVACIDRLRDCRDILLLGDGDGRFLNALLRVAPEARVHSVDASQAMLNLAAARLTSADRSRVTFEQADARAFDAGARTFDAVVTLFFLDCFVEADVRALIDRLAPRLRPGGVWLFADFAIPERGIARLYAKFVVSSLYLFFRWRTHLVARNLPPSEALLADAGLELIAEREFRGGLLRSSVWRL
jgi:ubiquinone/menaquinone biosynthesis C-methylase UbiE